MRFHEKRSLVPFGEQSRACIWQLGMDELDRPAARRHAIIINSMKQQSKQAVIPVLFPS